MYIKYTNAFINLQYIQLRLLHLFIIMSIVCKTLAVLRQSPQLNFKITERYDKKTTSWPCGLPCKCLHL